MKYWRGYLVALIAAACAWGLSLFASSHRMLMDTIFPYMTRLVLDSLAQWSSSVNFCLWQLAVLVFLAAILTTVVLMIALRWNPIQCFGWVLAVVSIVNLLNTGVYELNQYVGPLSEDLRLDTSVFTISELEDAATYYRDKANELSAQVSRGPGGYAEYDDFEVLAQQAEAGFQVMVYERSGSVFAGCMVPVKELGWSDYYTSKGVTGMTVGLTGESAVNPQVPDVGLPFAICHEMAHRMSIYNDSDANFAAFAACEANPDPQFRYTAYLMAYRACYNALAGYNNATADAALIRIERGEYPNIRKDLNTYEDFLKNDDIDDDMCTMLVSWHIQNVVIPALEQDDLEQLFDPTDESQVDLSGIVNAKQEEEP